MLVVQILHRSGQNRLLVFLSNVRLLRRVFVVLRSESSSGSSFALDRLCF